LIYPLKIALNSKSSFDEFVFKVLFKALYIYCFFTFN
jgi:hypothetical protein